MNKLNENRGFYIVLSLCITAIGVAGYVNLSDEKEIATVVSQNAIIEKSEVVTIQPQQEILKDTTPVNSDTQDDDALDVKKQEKVQEPEQIEEIIEDTAIIDETKTEATVTISPTVEITKIQEIFVRPCDGGVINSNSMDELVKNVSMNDWRTHNATDYAVSPGQNISAIANGEVIAIETTDQFGTMIEIHHNDGLVTKIFGLNSDTVAKIGDSVVAGDVIATAMGSFPAEIVEGDHIHVEATRDGENIDVETLF